jgi:hypothetical protein
MLTPEDNVIEGLFVMPYARNPHFIGRDAYKASQVGRGILRDVSLT